MNKTELALALDITTRQLRSLASRGMPTDSLKAAQTWRSTHLDITQTKRCRIDGNPGKTIRPLRKPEAKKAEAEVGKLLSDPYGSFLIELLSDSMPRICAELMEESGLSMRQSGDAYLAICWAIGKTRNEEGYESSLGVCMASPTQSFSSEEWKEWGKEKKAEIERLVLESREL